MSYLKYFKGKKIVVPGGNGFFGSHIIDKLRRIECKIFVPKTKDGIDFRKYEDCFSYFDDIELFENGNFPEETFKELPYIKPTISLESIYYNSFL